MSVVFRRLHGRVLIEVEGELDLASASHLEECLSRAMGRDDGSAIHLDLSGVTFIDLSGWEVITDAAEAVERRGGRLSIVGLSRCVRRLTELVGVHQALAIADGREDANSSAILGR